MLTIEKEEKIWQMKESIGMFANPVNVRARESTEFSRSTMVLKGSLVLRESCRESRNNFAICSSKQNRPLPWECEIIRMLLDRFLKRMSNVYCLLLSSSKPFFKSHKTHRTIRAQVFRCCFLARHLQQLISTRRNIFT